VLRYERVPDPVPAEGQVRIAVDAAGVHVIDTMIRRAADALPAAPPQLPMTPGREVAGIVDTIGPDVEPGWLGLRAVAHLGQVSGGYADLALAPAASLHELPIDLPADVAVAMIGTGRTAVAILEAAELTSTDVVVVTAAVGGLGSLFVQAGASLGATVAALAGGSRKVEIARSLGAGIAVDYTRRDWIRDVLDALGGRRPTVALDGVGGALGRAVFELLGDGGRLVRFGWSSGRATDIGADELDARAITDVTALGARIARREGGIRALEAAALAKAKSGAWQPITQAFPLARAGDAHQAIETRATIGKVVLVP
jgi:NADPH2:quinone reductase